MEIFNYLAKNYLEGKATKEEQQLILDDLRQHKEKQFRFKQIKTEWESDETNSVSFTTYQSWIKLQNRINTAKRKTSIRLVLYKTASIAAVIMLVILIFGIPALKNQVVIVTTQPGQTIKVKLPDSSNVLLNGNSTLTYRPLNFFVTRNVKLKGEAYFNVTKNTLKPFIVNSDHLKVKVLGTQFNISDCENSENAYVVLEKGSVTVSSPNIKKRCQILKPGQMAMVSKSSDHWTTKDINTRLYTSWTKGILYFYDTPFLDMIRKLELRFGITMQINDPELYEFLISTTFKDESLQQILDIIQKALPVKAFSEKDLIGFSLDHFKYDKYKEELSKLKQ